MHEAHEFLKNLALVLCVAALATVVFQRLRQPVVFGYLLAGLIVGPHLPIPLVADETMVRTLAELGVILLMFSLGLEFNIGKLLKLGPTVGFVAVAQSGALFALGFSAGKLFGWTPLECVYAGAIISISSTTIIVKAFAEQGVRGRVAETVFGVLIFEDIIAIFLLVILTTISTVGHVSAGALGLTAVRLATFLALLVGVGILIVPRLIRGVVKLNRPETTLVASVGLCFAFSLLALRFGYSVALGAFFAGSLIAESGVEKSVEHLVTPVRDLFGAIFFVSVGMLIDPALVAEHWLAVIVLSGLVIAGNLLIVSVATFLTGADARTSVQVAMSLGQIGEFSFIIAGLGIATGATGGFLYPVAIAVSALTTLTTPWMIRAAPRTAAYIDRKLPRSLQTFAALYGSWIERLRTAPPSTSSRSAFRRLVGLIVLDTVVLGVLIVGTAVELGRFVQLLRDWTGLSVPTARVVVIATAATVAAPLLFGGIRTARRLALALATQALPAVAHGKVDNAAAPRRALVLALQLAIVIAAGVPLVVATQPFIPPLGSFAALATVLFVLLIAFWRSTRNLQSHTAAGAELIAALFARQLSRPANAPEEPARAKMLEEVLPGLGQPEALALTAESPAVGKSLADLNIRGETGATILAINRAGSPVVIPSGHEVLREGDIIALAGSHDAINAARAILLSARE